jgi:hypothetical protein
MPQPLTLTRSQILSFRRSASFLEARLPHSAKSLCQAAWAGLQDSVPRAALLSLHARIRNITPTHWEHESLAQLWGPRHNVYVVAQTDIPIFTLGRLPASGIRLTRAQTTASRLHATLNSQRLPFAQAGRALGVPHNSLRYAAPTGTVLMRWDGARQPHIWTIPAPTIDPQQARLELARRYLHIFGPSTAASFAKWAGILPAEAKAAFAALAPELISVRTPIGEAIILAKDEPAFRALSSTESSARLLPSGDTFYLLWSGDRELLVPDPKHRAQLWTTRVWPGALLVNGEIAGTWRRAAHELTLEPWRRLTSPEREAVEAEALSLPLPDLKAPIQIRWN